MDESYRRMVHKLSTMTDEELIRVWEGLYQYDPDEEYAPGISMDDWAMEVKGQLDYRGI